MGQELALAVGQCGGLARHAATRIPKPPGASLPLLDESGAEQELVLARMPKACIDSPSWFRAAVQVPPYPRAALGSMRTVPAQIFCAPTGTALIAASRCMPGVCAMLGPGDRP